MEISEENSDSQKQYENEEFPLKLSTMDIINNISSRRRKNNEKQQKKRLNIIHILIWVLLVLIFFITIIYIILLLNSPYYDIDLDIEQYKNQNQNKNQSINNIINQSYTVNNTGPKIINNTIKVIQSNKIDLPKKNLSVGFLYSCLVGNGIARFMVVTGDYFVKKGYNVYFITKPPHPKDFKYNEKIKRIHAYNNITLLKEVLKSGILDILIVNNAFNPGTINMYKSYGIKVIGIYHGVFISPMFNNITSFYRAWKYTELYDAYVQIGIDDYYFFKSYGFKKNIFIPNLYTFEPSETPNANLTSHNLMMLGRLADKKKGVIYAIKAMELIVKEVPDAKLYLVSSDSSFNEFKNLTQKLNLTNNVVFTPFTCKISDYLLNTSIFFFPSITEAFPMALNEAKAYGLPCLTFDISYSVPYQSGVVKVDMFDYEALAREAIKLLKDYDYRVRIGKEAKLSLNKFNNNDTTNLWSRLFNALLAGGDEYQKLRKEIESKYYNEELAEKHMEKQLNNLKRYNKFFRCHSLKNFTNIDYVNTIEPCKNVELLRRN